MFQKRKLPYSKNANYQIPNELRTRRSPRDRRETTGFCNYLTVKAEGSRCVGPAYWISNSRPTCFTS